MREKREYVIVTFRTTTDAMGMERSCSISGVPGRLIPVPREITAGCGLAWRILPDAYEEHKETMKSFGISFEGIYRLTL